MWQGAWVGSAGFSGALPCAVLCLKPLPKTGHIGWGELCEHLQRSWRGSTSSLEHLLGRRTPNLAAGTINHTKKRSSTWYSQDSHPLFHPEALEELGRSSSSTKPSPGATSSLCPIDCSIPGSSSNPYKTSVLPFSEFTLKKYIH